ncbi:MAG: AAA family ATPase, partial [Thermoplasmata archaeon]
MIIIISGPPGSGKTTVARILSKMLDFPLIS